MESKWQEDELKIIINNLLKNIEEENKNINFYKYNLKQLLDILNINKFDIKNILDKETIKKIKKLKLNHKKDELNKEYENIKLENLISFLPEIMKNEIELNKMAKINFKINIPISIFSKEFIDNKKTFKLVHDSLNDFDNNLGDKLKKSISHDSINIGKLKSGIYGFCLPIISLHKCYIAINSDKTINDPFYLTHELGHSYTLDNKLINYDIEKHIRSSLLDEVLPVVFSLILSDYLEKNKEVEKAKYIKYKLLSIIKKSLKIYAEISDLSNLKENNEKININHTILTYIYSYLLAFKLFDIYKKDKEKGKKILNAFSDNFGILSDLELIQKLKINTTDFINKKYFKTKIEEIKK